MVPDQKQSKSLQSTSWDDIHPFFYSCGMSDDPACVCNNRSRFNTIKAYFQDKEFNRDNFNAFLMYRANKGNSKATQNKYISMARHIIDYLECPDFLKKQKLLKTHWRLPQILLTPDEIQKLANVEIPYRKCR